MGRTSELGLVQIYTGKGKGKTTAALGLALRASGQGFRVGFLQFLKADRDCGEHYLVQKYPLFEIVQPATKSVFTARIADRRSAVQETLIKAREMMESGSYDLLVLDEILTAFMLEDLSFTQVKELIAGKPAHLELVLTGRGASPEIITLADLATEMVPLKHPFDRGIAARRGVEY